MMNNLFSIDKRMLVYGLNESYPSIFCFSTTRSADIEHLVDITPQRPDEFIFPHQVHGVEVLAVDHNFLSLENDEKIMNLDGVDAIMTNVPGICLCIRTADCIPVVLYDKRNNAVAAIHAGWRGTVERIVEKTLLDMCSLYGTKPEDVSAVIGPGISLLSFEVGDEVYSAFSEAGFDMNIVARKYRKWHIDLWEVNRMQLIAMGVHPSNIETSGICTYINHEVFFSARRQGIDTGRIVTGIMLKR